MGIEKKNSGTESANSVVGSQLLLFMCISAVCAFSVWSVVGELDIVSNANGEVVPSSQVKKIQHLEGGIVLKILISEGNKVVTNQPLVILESTRNRADLNELNTRLTATQINIVRFKAELAQSATVEFGQDLLTTETASVEQALALFKIRQQRLENQLNVQRNVVIQRKHAIAEVQARLNYNAKVIVFLKEQIEISERLLKQELSNRMVHVNFLKEAAELEGKLHADKANLQQSMSALKEARIRLDAIQNTFQEDARKELDEALRTFTELSQRRQKYDDSLRRTVLRSPVAGTVKALYVYAKAEVVQPGGTVLDIVPADDRLVVEAKLPTQDIGFVRLGQKALIQLASNDAMRFGNLEGDVTHISADTLITKEGMPYYKIRIQPVADHFQRGINSYQLHPGMLVLCSVQTGKRSILEYLLDPFLRAKNMALRER